MKKVFAILFGMTTIISACNSSGVATPFMSAPIITETKIRSTAILSTPTDTPVPPTPTLVSENTFIKGITLNDQGLDLDTKYSYQVIDQYIIPSGINYVALSPTCFSEDRADTKIVCTDEGSPGIVLGVSDQELVNAIKHLHSVGLRVILKPHALVKDDFVNQQSHPLGSDWNETRWAQWFDSYIAFITHYAQIAEEQDVDMFVVGNEQQDTTYRERDWRHVIAAVKEIYHGPTTYAANAWGFEASNVKFWDALDYIGTNAYIFGHVDKKNPTIDDMQQHWTSYLKTLEEMSTQYGKQILITEIGARSVQGYNEGDMFDWESAPYDGPAQADFYTAFFEALKDKSWLKGIILWDMNTAPLQGGANDAGYSFIAKPAEQIVHQYFGGVEITSTPVPNFVESPNETMIVYDENLAAGWRPWYESEDKAFPDFRSPGGHESSYSIRVAYSEYIGLWLIHDSPVLDMSKYRWLEFYIMVGTNQPKHLLAIFEDWTTGINIGSRMALVNDPMYIEGGEYEPGTWQRVKIPLVDLGITNQLSTGFNILGCAWPCDFDYTTDDVYIDDIKLIAGE